MAISADMNKVLDRGYEDMDMKRLVDAPVEALAGVSENDAEMLKKAFGIKTIGDMGRNKYMQAAYAIVRLSEACK
ncbi:hypothetical protein [Actinoallomurus rhizosphaericola]|uniref:hypothetical protein n=1 Tax=Actinoallomurus rhizosphaericola TaxID=2952536 RepID=UPI002092665F|nr:hypothetical protein [Actinoallomurus rhizosphaericola]MCO5999144.1 hypothetical protein [Actinoallomurus rhizosphaericola]